MEKKTIIKISIVLFFLIIIAYLYYVTFNKPKQATTNTLICPTGQGYVDSSKNACVSCKDNNMFIDSNGICNICANNTPYNSSGTCVANCPATLPYNNNGACVASCSSPLSYINNGTCVERCTGTSPFNNNGTCVVNCPATSPYNNNGTCVASCSAPLQYPNKNGTCVASCPSGTYVNNGTCVDNINFPVTSIIPATVLTKYGTTYWTTTPWLPSGTTNPFTSDDSWIYTNLSDVTAGDLLRHVFQLNYTNNTPTSKNATLNIVVDDYLASVRINNNPLTYTSGIYKLNTLPIILLPGINLIEITTQKLDTKHKQSGLIFNIKDNLGNVLARSDNNVMKVI
jgi:hypothetical protein